MRTTVVNSKPILFSPAMVRAIIEGRKTQTRRIVKPQPDQPAISPGRGGFYTGAGGQLVGAIGGSSEVIWPRYTEGDVLWVRERCFDVRPCRTAPIFDGVEADFIYEADIHNALDGDHRFDSWSLKDQARMRKAKVIGCHQFKPSIHMPREACRLWLRVEAVRVEWVESISEADATAEGIVSWQGPHGTHYGASVADVWERTARGAFLRLFYDINARVPRGSNPWVWVYTFSRAEKPEGWPR